MQVWLRLEPTGQVGSQGRDGFLWIPLHFQFIVRYDARRGEILQGVLVELEKPLCLSRSMDKFVYLLRIFSSKAHTWITIVT